MPASGRPVLACFAFERGDARVRKRVAALQAGGWDVRGFMFHRIRDKAEEPPFWDDVELGITENRRYLKRILVLLGSLGRLWKHRHTLRQASVFYVINTDNALLALAARLMARRPRPAPLVLELADVQPAMLGHGWPARLMRAGERFVLRRISLLVTTSPGFVEHYFIPFQNYTGPTFLLENKVYPSTGIGPVNRNPELSPSAGPSAPAPSGDQRPSARGGRPWVIGLFGAFRCRRSIELMRELAARFPDRLHFYLRGYPSGTDAAGITALLRDSINPEWAGPYQYPGDLPDLYSRVDLNWTFDFADEGANSAWLLPNRIYEGGLFGCPALADAGTETGRWVRTHHAGWVLDQPGLPALAAFFESLTLPEWQEKQTAAGRLPRTLTCGEADYALLSATLAGLAAGSSSPRSRAGTDG